VRPDGSPQPLVFELQQPDGVAAWIHEPRRQGKPMSATPSVVVVVVVRPGWS
jgi:hypothetical protein